MTKQRKSSRVLALTGAYQKNPNRENKQEPKLDALSESDIPNHLDESSRGCFIELMGFMPVGVYTKAEIPLLEIASKLLADSRSNWLEFPSSRMSQLIKCFSMLGLSPGDRTRLVVPDNKPNKFADL